MEAEMGKILGRCKNREVECADLEMYANCARVAVADGHLESAVILLDADFKEEDAIKKLAGFRAEPQRLKLPTAPLRPIIVRTEPDRPQPLWDLNAGEPRRARGMAVTVGRIRKKNKYLKMFLLSHNTIRGGAGGSVLNAELALKKGLLK